MTVLFLTSDLVFSSRVAASASQMGATLRTVMAPAKLADEFAAHPDVSLLLIDLYMPGLDIAAVVVEARAAVSHSLGIVAYGPHVHEDRLGAAREAGCDEVLTRGQFNSQIDAVLSRWTPAAPA